MLMVGVKFCWFSARDFPYYEFVRNVVGVLCIVAILVGRLWFCFGTAGGGNWSVAWLGWIWCIGGGARVGLLLAEWLDPGGSSWRLGSCWGPGVIIRGERHKISIARADRTNVHLKCRYVQDIRF